MKYLAIAIAAVCLSAPLYAQQDERFKSFNDIVTALDPLEFIANDGGVRRSIDLRIRFGYDSDGILEQAGNQLKALGEALDGSRLSQYHIRVIGHTDAVGDAAYNQQLSQRRAQAVRQHLIETYQIDAARLVAVGKGETALLDKLPEDAAVQRRVEIEAFLPSDHGVNSSSEQKTQKAAKQELEKKQDGTLNIAW